ncbi:hypothetical protein C8Q72DRAFT_198987 [Fomitopsis betulina]|nr:hypothetical protein C8Q72DRAFT_198987 [Fomitopsis betulina]
MAVISFCNSFPGGCDSRTTPLPVCGAHLGKSFIRRQSLRFLVPRCASGAPTVRVWGYGLFFDSAMLSVCLASRDLCVILLALHTHHLSILMLALVGALSLNVFRCRPLRTATLDADASVPRWSGCVMPRNRQLGDKLMGMPRGALGGRLGVEDGGH